MKLTPIKVLISTLSPDDIEEYQKYQDTLEATSDSIVRSTISKPSLPEAVYKIKYYNMDQYMISTWAADWDKIREKPIIIAVMLFLPTNSLEVINAQYTETEWKKFLLKLGYTHDE